MQIVAANERPFIAFLGDAIVFAQIAQELEGAQRLEPSRFPRASIIASVLAVECAANCCIDALVHSSRFKNDVDRLPLISKFEMFLTLRQQGVALDRGSKHIQNVQELKAIRDDLVHARKQRVEMHQVDESTYEGVQRCFPMLGISKLWATWRAPDAILVLRASVEF